MGWHLRFLSCLLGLVALAGKARADELKTDPGASVQPTTPAAAAAPVDGMTWLPGDARVITHATSASRDTALMDVIAYPRISVTLGSEFGLFRYRFRGVSFGPGVYALFNLESRTRAKHLFPAPGGDSDLWRGSLGYELTFSLDDLARHWLGERGALEFALGYYHESEHHSASNSPVHPGDIPDHPQLRGLPQIDNYVQLDAATRTSIHEIEFVARAQTKLFANGPQTQHLPFRYGLGADFMVRWRHFASFQPYWATFGEVLSSPVRRDVNSLRSLLGIAFPGGYGELSLYLSVTAGGGRGLLMTQSSTDFGGGLRYSPFHY